MLRIATAGDEVRSWYFEVWNEPNPLRLLGRHADQKAYFDLYDTTARSIKSIDPALRVGGPATAGAAWVPEFLAHAKQSGTAVDFVTTHSYGVDGGFLDEAGKSDTKLSPSPECDHRRCARAYASRSPSRRPFPSNCHCISPEWSTSWLSTRGISRCMIPTSAHPTS